MTTPNKPLEPPNFLPSAGHNASVNTPIFTGELRVESKEYLSTSLAGKRASIIFGLIEKDPSLALESIPWKTCLVVRPYEHIDFPFACVDRGFDGGIEFAIQHGYPINKRLPTGETLLSLAVYQQARGYRESSSAIGLLLSLGADPNISSPFFNGTGMNLLALMRKSLNEIKPNFALLNQLLDAKVDVTPIDNQRICPLSELVKVNGWKDAAIRPQLTQFMDRLVKVGCNVNSRSGIDLETPIEVAVNEFNVHAVIALVRLGAEPKFGNETLLDVMARSRTLRDHIPVVQSAIMQRTIATSISSNAASPTPSESPKPENRSPRRRMGGV